jgi:hypothetical protein
MALKDVKGHASMRDTLRQLRQLLRVYVAEGHKVLLFVKPGQDPSKVHERLQDIMGDTCKVSTTQTKCLCYPGQHVVFAVTCQRTLHTPCHLAISSQITQALVL